MTIGVRPERPPVQPAACPEHSDQRLLDQIVDRVLIGDARCDHPADHRRQTI